MINKLKIRRLILLKSLLNYKNSRRNSAEFNKLPNLNLLRRSLLLKRTPKR